MTIKVDKDVPVPAYTRVGRPSRYPWSEMEVGDSFFVPVSEGEDIHKLRTSISGSRYAYTKGMVKRHGVEYRATIRTVTEGGVEGVRAWRLK